MDSEDEDIHKETNNIKNERTQQSLDFWENHEYKKPVGIKNITEIYSGHKIIKSKYTFSLCGDNNYRRE